MAQALYCEIDGLEVEVLVRDFSAVGFFVQSISPPDTDTEIEMFLRSDIGSMSVSAIIVSVVTCEQAAADNSRPGFAALFTDLSESDRGFLARTTEEVKRSIQPPGVAGSDRPPDSGQIEFKSETKRPVREAKASPTPKGATVQEQEASMVLSKVRALLERDGQRSAWRVLGVTANSPIDEAKRAFLSLAKQHHPHVYARYRSPELNRTATRLFILHKKAYSEFCKDAARNAADGKPPAPKRSKRSRGQQSTRKFGTKGSAS